jgi:UDP-GlcNAc3NAcA epimerase
MSDVFFEEMRIPKPDYYLGIGGKSHGAMTGQMVEEIEKILLNESPDWVLVYGDTNSTLAGAIAAAKLNIKIAHVEAGLRSYNSYMPEETNRILTDRISSLLFCPTQRAIDNLNNEGIRNWQSNAKALLSGDVMQDGAMFYRSLSRIPQNLEIADNFVLCTIHRAENTDDKNRLFQILSALNEIAQHKQVVLPLHPRTHKILQSGGLNISNLSIIDPVGYLNMIWLLDNCDLVMTDSGGLQKEAYFFSVPCITMRDETEWVELVDFNVNTLTGADKSKILAAYNEVTKNPLNGNSGPKFDTNLYGDGHASQKIVRELLNA